jgi:hypothetical protein
MRITSFGALLLGLLASFSVGPAAAADQFVLGQAILVKDPVPPDTIKRFVRVFAKDNGGGQTIVGDPTVGGATLRVIVNGAIPSDQTFDLPASGWTFRTNAAGLVYYKYRDDGTNGAVKVAEIKLTPSGIFLIRAAAQGKLGTVDVVPPNPGADATAVLAITGGDTYCTGFGGATGGIVSNRPPGNPFKLFAVRRPAARIGACPP